LASATSEWPDYKLDCIVHVKYHQITSVEKIPSVTQMLLRASTHVPPFAQDWKNEHKVANRDPSKCKRRFSNGADIGIEAVFSIAKQQRLWGRSCTITYAGTIKEVLGTCHMIGLTVDGWSAVSIQQAINIDRKPSPCKIESKARNENEMESSKEEKNNEKEKEKNKDEQAEKVECPIPNEALVLPFIRADGSLELSLCRTTTMTPTEIEERRLISLQKRLEGGGEKVLRYDCGSGMCARMRYKTFRKFHFH